VGPCSHSMPFHPPSHLHLPCSHSPCPPQVGSGQLIAIAHCHPIHPALHTHVSGTVQSPLPLQQVLMEQSMPPHQAKHKQEPSTQFPLPEQKLGQNPPQSAPVYPVKHWHVASGLHLPFPEHSFGQVGTGMLFIFEMIFATSIFPAFFACFSLACNHFSMLVTASTSLQLSPLKPSRHSQTPSAAVPHVP